MPPDAPQLNTSQRRRLWAVLRTIEERLDGLGTLLGKDDVFGVAYRVHNPFSPAQRGQLRRMLGRFREGLSRFSQRFDLPVQEEDLAQLLRSTISGAWVDLSECRAKYLRGYGAVSDDTEQELDTRVEELLALLEKLSDFVDISALQGGEHVRDGTDGSCRDDKRNNSV